MSCLFVINSHGAETTFILLAEASPVKPSLAADETIINPYYMRQLLQYGIKLGESQSTAMDAESLLREAEVCIIISTISMPY